jgi:hypothetical protein
VVKELEQDAMELFMHLGKLWRGRTGAGRRRRRGGRGKLGNGVPAREKGHQGLASGGGDALEVEVALAGGAGAGGDRGRSLELKRRQQLTGRAE